MYTKAEIMLTIAAITPTVRASTFPVNTPKPKKNTIAPTMRCHHPQVLVLTLMRLSFVTTNVSGLMIPARPAASRMTRRS